MTKIRLELTVNKVFGVWHLDSSAPKWLYEMLERDGCVFYMSGGIDYGADKEIGKRAVLFPEPETTKEG